MSGQVRNQQGYGIPFVRVTTFTTPDVCHFSWTGSAAFTNPFGYYSTIVHSDCPFAVTASKKGQHFETKLYAIGQPLENVDFIAE